MASLGRALKLAVRIETARSMTAPRRKREIFANPFFAILLLASVVFVFTVLAYLSSAWVLDPKPGRAATKRPIDCGRQSGSTGTRRLLLGGEFVVMLGDGRAGDAASTRGFRPARNRSHPSEAGHGKQADRAGGRPASRGAESS